MAPNDFTGATDDRFLARPWGYARAHIGAQRADDRFAGSDQSAYGSSGRVAGQGLWGTDWDQASAPVARTVAQGSEKKSPASSRALEQEDHRWRYPGRTDVDNAADRTRAGGHKGGPGIAEGDEGHGLKWQFRDAYRRFVDQENPEDRWLKWSALLAAAVLAFKTASMIS